MWCFGSVSIGTRKSLVLPESETHSHVDDDVRCGKIDNVFAAIMPRVVAFRCPSANGIAKTARSR